MQTQNWNLKIQYLKFGTVGHTGSLRSEAPGGGSANQSHPEDCLVEFD